MNLFDFTGKVYLIFGVANRKSIAYFSGKTLETLGATVLYSVRSEARKEELSRWLNPDNIFVCDVEKESNIRQLKEEIASKNYRLDGILHSLAFANFSEGFKPFYETKRQDFLQAAEVSCFSLVEIARHFKSCCPGKRRL